MKKTRVVWTRQAQEDLREIRKFIARDAPYTARAFITRLKTSVDKLKLFPESGKIVPEIGRAEIREILHGSYRIIYRYREGRLEILLVFHSARLLDDESRLSRES